MTVPSENNLSLVDLNELFAKIELRSVLKIKVLFMKWVTELVSNTIDQASQFTACSSPQCQDAKMITDIPEADQDQEEGKEDDEPAKEIEFCKEEDCMIENPQKRIKCCLCGFAGELKITGRLIPFQINLFVHVNCEDVDNLLQKLDSV